MTPMDTTAKDELLDLNAMLERVGGDAEFLATLIALYVEQWPDWFEEVRRAVEARDSATLRTSAHFIKGGVANFSVGRAYQASLRLEMMGKANDLTAAPHALSELRESLERLAVSLARLCSS